jgi:hypothetical protein
MTVNKIPFVLSPAHWEERDATHANGMKRWKMSVEYYQKVAIEDAIGLYAIHKGIRVVFDGSTEYAMTCDDCGLWAHVSRKVGWRRDTVDHRGGALLDVIACDALELHRRFGSVVLRDEDEAWNGYTGWDFEPVLNWDHLAGYTDLRGVKKAHWKAKRKVWSDEESTEEQGSGSGFDWVMPD